MSRPEEPIQSIANPDLSILSQTVNNPWVPSPDSANSSHLNNFVPHISPTNFYVNPYSNPSSPYSNPAIVQNHLNAAVGNGYFQQQQQNQPWANNFTHSSFNLMPAEPFMPQNTRLGQLETRVRTILNVVGNIIRAFGSVAQLFDSSVYAAWSSIMALVAVGEHLRHFHEECVSRWITVVRVGVSNFLSVIKPKMQIRSQQKYPNSTDFTIFYDPICRLVVPATIAGVIYVAKCLLSPSECLTENKTDMQNRERDELVSETGKKCGIVIENFQALDQSCLTVEKGQKVVIVHEKDSNGWLYVSKPDDWCEGFIPASHLLILESHQ